MSFAEVTRYEPTFDADFAAYWDGARHGRLVLWRCGACANTQVFPPDRCRTCHDGVMERVEASGCATVYSVTIVHRAPTPNWTAATPYAIALVDLDEGPRLMTNIVGCDPGQITLGMPVKVDFEWVSESLALPLFRPI